MKIYCYINKKKKMIGAGLLFPHRKLLSFFESIFKQNITVLKDIKDNFEISEGFIIIIPYNKTEYVRGRYDYFKSVKGEIISYFDDDLQVPSIFICKEKYYTYQHKIIALREQLKNYAINIDTQCNRLRVVVIPFTLSDQWVVSISSYNKIEKFFRRDIADELKRQLLIIYNSFSSLLE